MYSMKSTINKSKLTFRSLTTLFDSFIKPIGAPIFTPTKSIIKHIAKRANQSDEVETNTDIQTNILKKISLFNSEKVHLHFLKCCLASVLNHSTVDLRNGSNIDCWKQLKSMHFWTLIPNHPHDIGLKCSPGEILAKNCLDQSHPEVYSTSAESQRRLVSFTGLPRTKEPELRLVQRRHSLLLTHLSPPIMLQLFLLKLKKHVEAVPKNIQML